ncbi:MAG: flap endonuclease [Actinobacteria bacterium]|nr:flap endonuclease [Actinomycetota bacterium]MCA1719977.1 flap endonuclease [Actinomycetota bacterium]
MAGQLTVIDAPSLWYRAFHGVPESITAPDGSPVNAVRGFLDLTGRIVRDTRPARLVCCLDLDWRPSFRVDAVPSYKAHRLAENGAEAEPESLAPQVAVLLEVLAALGVAVAGVEGYEADDVLGTLATREPGPVDVVTGDRDLFQLVDDSKPVRVVYTVEKMKPYGEGDVTARYGIPGRGYADFAVLRGDPSDGLPGVKGVGEKTAAALVGRFGTVEQIVAALDSDVDGFPAGARAKLAAAREYLRAAPAVTRVVRDLPVPELDDALPRTPRDPARLLELSDRWGLESPLNRFLAACEVAHSE